MVKAVKLADIAERLGVSIVTVSKALSGQKGVSEELREKIKTLADEMGYTPIHSPQGTKAKSYTIGVLTFEHYFTKFASFYWKMYQELATRAVRKNCFTMLEVISSYDEENLTEPKLIEEERVNGIVIIGRPKEAYLKMLYKYQHMPMIFLDFYDDEEKVDSVISGSFYGMYRMTDYLIKNGHTKIGFVGTLLYTDSITDRYFGYCRALLENGLELRQDWIVKDRECSDGIMGLNYQMNFPKDMPTAFVCNNDIAAYALIKQLEQKGYRVPEDISVVGYDDYLYAEWGDSHITTYAVDMGEMTKVALSCLIKRIENLAVNTGVHVINGSIVVRDTVKKIN